MAYPKFKPTKEFYLKYRGKKALLGKKVVTVDFYRTESRGGSWATGFRFYNSEWAVLTDAKKRISFDQGKTWHDTSTDWYGRGKKAAFKATKGKLRLTSSNHGEFAFEGIQKLNRDYEGSGYRWHR